MSQPLPATKTLPRSIQNPKCLLSMCTQAPTRLRLPVALTNEVAILLKSRAFSNGPNHPCTPYRYVPEVPQEIIDIIVDNIHDMASLRACSLVCWAFVPASRTHIFRTVSLNMLNDHPTRLFDILSCNPQLAVYIRDLTIYRSCDTHLWMQPGSPLPALLSRLNHVERFSIFGCWGFWKDVPHAMQTALTRVVSLRSLDRLHILATKDVSPTFLNCALSVRVLSLFHVSVDGRQNVKRSFRLPYVRENGCASPEYLNLSLDSHVARILDHMRTDGVSYFSKVRRLAANPIPNSVNGAGNFAKVLAEVETTLERLDVQVHESHYEPFDTSRLTKLREFQIHVIKDEGTVNAIPELLPGLIARVCKTNPLLRSISMVILLGARAVEAGLDFPCVDRLKEVDRQLADGFPQLREVVVKIVAEASPPTLVLNYPQFVWDHLPRTRKRGVLRVEEGTRPRGDAVMPLLPYTSVFPHRSSKKQPTNESRR